MTLLPEGTNINPDIVLGRKLENVYLCVVGSRRLVLTFEDRPDDKLKI